MDISHWRRNRFYHDKQLVKLSLIKRGNVRKEGIKPRKVFLRKMKKNLKFNRELARHMVEKPYDGFFNL